MATKEKGRTFDGITRPSNDLYRENFDKIFGKKQKTLLQSYLWKVMKKKRKNKMIKKSNKYNYNREKEK